ncbi:unnamed protein product [Protopolystoma xenopodis]|uniref:Uncharacterized protein n=1 Tax=Protopolystoma xenopodis TaxID=117903 RepID=A0A3S5FHA7_9PLAT|nr:unnamed protein product [Protopolystoma xenopodis]
MCPPFLVGSPVFWLCSQKSLDTVPTSSSEPPSRGINEHACLDALQQQHSSAIISASASTMPQADLHNWLAVLTRSGRLIVWRWRQTASAASSQDLFALREISLPPTLIVETEITPVLKSKCFGVFFVFYTPRFTILNTYFFSCK